MNIDTAFPSKYLKAADLPEDGSQAFVIEKVAIEEIGREKQQKPVIYFVDDHKAFVCNKTNCNTIAKVTGSRDTDDWIGKTIHLYRADVQFGDEMVESIRVKLKAAKPAPQPEKKKDEGGEEIPF